MKTAAKRTAISLCMALCAASAHASVQISNAATKNMSCSAGVCSPTAKDAVLNVNDLANMLTAGNVKVTTGAGAVTITIAAPFSWTSTHRLTLDAYFNVSFRAPVTVAGTGAVTITTNDGGTGGDLLFFDQGHLEFWDTESKLLINGHRYQLAQSFHDFRKYLRKEGALFVALAKSFDAAGTVYYFNPLGADVNGVLEGLGNTISNLTMEAGDEFGGIGLVGELGPLAQVRDIGLLSVNIKNEVDANPVGALVGQAGSGAMVVNSYATGQISNSIAGETGGLVGLSYGMITRSHASVTISTEGDAGGLVGDLICGSNPCTSKIDRSYSTGSTSTPSGFDASIGGLVGRLQSSSISNSYAFGAVTSTSEAFLGGLIGAKDVGAITEDCYATGAPTGGTGSVIGGLVGADDGADHGDNNTDLYWDLDTSGISDPSQGAGNIPNDPGITGLTDAQLKAGLPSGFDPAIWAQSPSINNGYPYLIANPPPK